MECERVPARRHVRLDGRAALVIEFVFQALHLVPHSHNARIVSQSIQLNYITILDIIFLALAGMLLVPFFRTAGP